MPTIDPTTGKPPRRRRWIPLSLRIFLALLGLLAVASFVWIGVPAYRQGVAIREIERLGGTVVRSDVGRAWLRDWLGNERMKMFDEVTFVGFTDGRQATDEALRHLPAFAHLRQLDIADSDNAPITEHGIAQAGDLKNLEILYLRDTQLNDAGLAALPEMPRLRKIYLAKSPVSDAGIAHLARYAGLEELELDSSFTDRALVHVAQLRNLTGLSIKSRLLTDEGLSKLGSLTRLTGLHVSAKRITATTTRQLATLPELRRLGLGGATDDALLPVAEMTTLYSLSLAGPEITDLGLAHLKGMSRLEDLSLGRTGGSDAGLVHLSGLTNLTTLSLFGDQYGDDALAHVRQLKRLSTLQLGRTRVTDAAVDELKRIRPGLTVMKH
ncbi:MAG: hypothetical protein HY296_04900 [Thaumarchaeota archaeon]|nr:hypothetical protein [Nitrososphaerota archaeon]